MIFYGGRGSDEGGKLPLKTADIVIVCLSRGSVNKEGYVQKEIKQALDVADEKPVGRMLDCFQAFSIAMVKLF